MREILPRFRTVALLGFVILILVGCAQSDSQPSDGASFPTSTPIPEWHKFETDELEIWLPQCWEGGSPKKDLKAIVEQLRNKGSDFEGYEALERNPDAYVLWAYDSDTDNKSYLTNVLISREKLEANVSIGSFMTAVEKQLPAGSRLAERSMVTLDDRYQAGRMIVMIPSGERSTQALTYVIDGYYWMYGVTFLAAPDEFDNQLSIFEQSVRTLRFKP